jgi:hypothetical protein
VEQSERACTYKCSMLTCMSICTCMCCSGMLIALTLTTLPQQPQRHVKTNFVIFEQPPQSSCSLVLPVRTLISRHAHIRQLEDTLPAVAMISQSSATSYNRRRGSKHDKTGCATCRTRFVLSEVPWLCISIADLVRSVADGRDASTMSSLPAVHACD